MKKIAFITFVMLFSMASWGQTTVNLDNAANWIQDGSTALTSYGNHTYSETGITIEGTNVLRNTTSVQDGFPGALGTYSMRIGNTAVSKIVITVSSGGVSSFSIKVRRWDGSPIPNYSVKFSTDTGINWTSLTNIDGALLTSSDWFIYSGSINDGSNNIKIEIANSGTTERIMIDDFTWTGYSSSDPTFAISSASSLTESNLNGAELTLALTSETFVASLETSDFTLNNAPAGTSIQSVSRVNDAEASITLAFDGTDFDEDVSNFNITASADALTGADALTSNNLTITAHTAPLATSNAATNTINGNATLNGTVTSKGYATTVTFEYSTDATLTTGVTELTASQSPLSADAVSSAVSYVLSGLSNGETYYFRVKAVNSEGTTLGSIVSFTPVAPPTLFISEVAHPSDIANAKFVEIYNYGSSALNLSESGIYLVRQTDTGILASVMLTGTLQAGSTYVVSYNEYDYLAAFGKRPDQYSGNISGNGDDSYYLYVNGNHSSGVLFDAFGVPNEDGTGKEWEYINSKAVRKVAVDSPNTTWTASEWVIVESPTERMSPGLFPATVWNGSTDNSWSEASNWDNGTPSTTTDVVMWGGASNFPEPTTETSVRNFAFKHNAQLNGQENLTINGTNTALHQIEFSTGHANLDRWQYYTSPFTNLTAGGMLSSNDRVDVYLTEYDNSISATINNAWSWLNSTTTPITPGKGFAATAVNDISESGDNINTSYYNMASTGTLVNAGTSVAVNLQYNEGEGQNNWNLMGNPYLATINWFDNTHLDYSKIQGSAAYLYDPDAGSYITLTSTGSGTGTVTPSGTQYIPPMQGFFVEAIAAGSFEISQAARVNDKQNFYKSEPILPVLRLNVSIDSLFDETVIIYNEMASNDFDRYDANKLITNGKSPQIYTTITSGHHLVFNHTHSLESNIGVQLIANTTGRYTLILNETGTLFNDYDITLTDHARNKSVRISDNDYLFDVDEEKSISNFILSFQKRTSINTTDLIDLKVFAIKKQLIIKSGYDHTGKITIYDTTGKKLLDQTVSGYYSTIEMPVRGGLFIVQLKGTNGTSHHKVFVNM